MSVRAPRPRWLLGWTTLALIATGCASGPLARRSEDPEPELRRRVLELEKQATKSRLEIERLRERVAELEVAELEVAASSGRNAAPAPVRAAPSPVRPAPSPPDRTRPAPPPASPPSSGIDESELEESDLDELGPPGASVRGDDETDSYEHALRLLRDGDPEAAETELRAFAAARPDSDLADNSWFWIGESLLVRDRVEDALEAFRIGVDRYPAGNKTPDALAKIGHCLELQGDRARAIEVWRELVRRFPNTAAAERAAEALGEP